MAEGSLDVLLFVLLQICNKVFISILSQTRKMKFKCVWCQVPVNGVGIKMCSVNQIDIPW